MVYIVTKTIKGHNYLYLSKSIRTGKKTRVVHVKYLGAESKFSQKDIKKLLKQYKNT